jgi:hypothetical protein
MRAANVDREDVPVDLTTAGMTVKSHAS